MISSIVNGKETKDPKASSNQVVIVLTESEWQAQVRIHNVQLEKWVTPHLRRQELGENHPVYDFLFSYYSLRPAALMRWTPGVGFLLEGLSARQFLNQPHFEIINDQVGLNLKEFPSHRLESLEWIHNLLVQTQLRAPLFGCSNLHEWAMEFENPKPRYPQVPLRLAPDDLRKFVSQQEIRCSHYDAFRFFTPSAKPLNQLQPFKKDQPNLEQSGCLHANMDLYKWAYKFYPWIPSSILAEAFLLAAFVREIDMRASPYDVSSYGLSPIKIETSEGRVEYLKYQIDISERSKSIRTKLIHAYRLIIDHIKDQKKSDN